MTTADAAPALAVTDLVITLGGREILHGVDVRVEPGQIVGFVGPNGAGKTTTIRAVLGIYPPGSGTVSVFGAPAGSQEARHRTGFALDSDGLYDGMTAAENVAFFQRLYRVPQDPERVREVLTLVGLAGRRDDDVRQFSRGMRQRVAIARALVHRPGLLVLDEPTSGVDPTGQSEIRRLLQEIADREGTAILMSSHNLEEVQRLARHIVVVADGRVQLSGDLATLREQKGRGQVRVTTTTALGERALAELRQDPSLGLRDALGTGLTFAPEPGVTRTRLVAAIAPHSDVERMTSDDASLEEMYGELVARAGSPDDEAAALTGPAR